ncbi:hypothetical protein [Aliikangiella sp. IMCC44359]|uniref:hypothetical protein n=1 Tax=Aliikangiella sp. IMCC44359 TaxID=3459125 RepID=UPI00403AABEC
MVIRLIKQTKKQLSQFLLPSFFAHFNFSISQFSINQTSQMIVQIGRYLGFACFFFLGQFFIAANTSAIEASGNSIPTGGRVVAGSGTITQTDLRTLIIQDSSSLFLDWDTFDLGINSQIDFLQPDANSVALNRILDQNPSEIHGRINANGHVILLNPYGILFGKTSTLNVGGLVASSLSISPENFMNGNYVFSDLNEGVDGQVINFGLINAATGGSVTLLGERVENHGLIAANLGSVNLAAGKEAVLTFDNQGLLGVKVTKAVLQDDLGVDPAVLNAGEITAAGGRILLTASVSEDVFSQAVNPGVIKQANDVLVHEDGSFTLMARKGELVGMGETSVGQPMARSGSSLGKGANVVNTGKLDVSLTDDALLNGQTSLNGQTAGGQITIKGENITQSGEILAYANNANGGHIQLEARDTLLLTEDSLTAARANGSNPQTGGKIELLGENVGLFDQATVDASGGNGGEVLIGGDRQGLNPLVRNAEFVYLGENTQVFADGDQNGIGNGGKVITFANDSARIFGDIFARGGSLGGNGGFIETSGLKGFLINTVPDVSAANGLGGEWLIDPYNIIIASSCSALCIPDDGDPFSSTDSLSVLAVGLIRDALLSGNVTITTGNIGSAGTEDGNITWGTNEAANLNFDGVNNNTLTLNAANNITFVKGNIVDSNTTTHNTLNLVLNAGYNGTTGGNSVNDGGGAINLGTTSIALNGGSFTATANSFSSTNATINTTGSENQNGGAININATTGDINVGVLTANGGSANRGGGGNPGVVGLNGGNITLTATAGDITASSAINSQGTTGDYRGNNSGQNGGNGGAINFNAGGALSVAAITTDGGDASGDSNDEGNGGNAGTITLTATSDLTISGNLSAVGGDATSISEGGVYGAGGKVTLSAAAINVDANVTTNATGDAFDSNSDSFDSTGFAITTTGLTNQNAGNIKITATTGNINVGTLTADGGVASRGVNRDTGSIPGVAGFNGGNITLNAQAVLGNITASGNISAVGTTGDDKESEVAGENGGAGGNINFSAGGTISVGAINVSGGDGKGDNTGINEANGGDAGDITLTGSGVILNGVITAQGGLGIGGPTSGQVPGKSGNGGDVTVTANSINIKADINALKGVANEGGDAGDTDGTVSININGDSGSVTIERTTAFTSTVNIQQDGAATGNQTLIGPNANMTWNIDGSNNGNLSALNVLFTGIENLTGGNSDDTFAFTSSGSLSGNINGGAGSDTIDYSLLASITAYLANISNVESLIGNDSATIVGDDVVNTWTISSDNSGSIGSLSFSNFQNITGGSDTDTFNYSGNSAIGINGAGGTDEVSYAGVDAATAITANLVNLTNIETIKGNANSTLVARNSINTWTINGNNTGSVDGVNFSSFQNLTGNALADTFNFVNGGVITGDIDGAAGTDEINYSAVDAATAVTVNLANISNIEQLTGNANSTIVAQNIVNTWTINGNNTGSVNGVNFSSFQNLTGGTDVDNFTFNDNSSLSGQVLSGDGNDTFTFYDNITVTGGINAGNNDDTFTYMSGTSITGSINAGAGNDTLDYSNLNTVSLTFDDIFTKVTNAEVVTGNGANSTLAGNNDNNTWNITGANQGNVAGITFNNFHHLTGGDGDDTFSFADGASIAGTINAGAGTDTVDYSLRTSAFDVTLANAFNGVQNAEVVKGNNLSTLIGNDLDNTWNITSDNSGTLTDSTGTLIFENFLNLIGGSQNDEFIFGLNGSLSGSIDGKGGTNTINYAAITAAITVNLANLLNIDVLVGNGHADSTLIGDNNNNLWQITDVNTGDVEGVDFSGFSNITAGTGVDTFRFINSGSISGNLDAGDGLDIVDYSLRVGAFTLNLANDVFNGVQNAEVIRGNNLSTLVATNIDNTWNITSANSGDVAGIFFENFANLTGGSAIDSFIFGVNGSLTGEINGQGGNDSISYAAITTAITVNLSDIFNVETLLGNDHDNSVLVADVANINNQWLINGLNSGEVNNIAFSQFKNLTGGSGDDTFSFTVDGNITGTVDAAGGTDIIDYSLQTVVNKTLANAANGVLNAEIIQGNNIDSTLTGDNSNNTWNITGENDGNINSSLTFIDFNHLIGGTGTDEFIFTSSGVLTGTINGGNGSDTIDYSALAIVTANLANLFNIETLIGNNTDSSLIGGNVSNTWTINGVNTGQVNGILFSGFNKLVGGNLDDTFRFTVDGDITNQIDAGAGTDTVDYSLQTVVVKTLADAANGVLNAEIIQGNNTNSTLIGGNATNLWNITGENDGNIGSLTFINFNHLTGGTGADTFKFAANGSLTGQIDGGVGDDTIDYSDLAQVIADLSDFSNIEALIGNNFDSTLISGNDDNTWVINGNNDGTLNNIRFTNFNHLTSGSGNDIFQFTAAGSIDGNVNAGAGTDTVDYSLQTTVSVTLSNAFNGVSNAEVIKGNNTNSTLIGNDDDNTWTITGENDGSVAGITFIDFNHLTAGFGDDTFDFSSTGSLTGNIDGGFGNDDIDYSKLAVVVADLKKIFNIESILGNSSDSLLIGRNVDTVWTIDALGGEVSNVTFTGFTKLTGGSGNDTFRFTTDSSVANEIDAGAGTDTVDYSLRAVVEVALADAFNGVLNAEIIRGNNTASTLIAGDINNSWLITGENDGSIGGVRFIDFNNLTGGSANDSFNFELGSNITGIINGGDGIDTIDYSLLSSVTVYLSNILNVESLTGNNTNSFLYSDNGTNAWEITGVNDGLVNGIIFNNFNNLYGGAGEDTFSFITGSSISGTIDAGGGTDIVDYSQQTTVVRTFANAFNGVLNAEIVQGNNTNSTLVGNDNSNVWTIDGDNDGNVAGIIFRDFNNLTGGNNNDRFNFTVNGILAGIINGSDGDDTIDYSLLTTVTANLANLANVEFLIGNNTASTLISGNGVNNWIIDGENDGSINGINFTDFNNLTGGSGIDTFSFASNGSVIGVVDAGDGNDIVDYSLQASVTVTLADALNGVLNAETVRGNNTDSTLIGGDTDNTWNITGANSGNIDGINFIDFNNLTGGAGNDTFVFVVGGWITDLIDGALGNDVIDYSLLASVTANLVNIVNVESLIGNNTDSTLVSGNGTNSWVINGENDGSVNGVSFTNFNNLTGGSGEDTFSFTTDGAMLGLVDAGDGDDIVDYSLQITVSVLVSDALKGVQNAEIVRGNNTDSTLVGDNVANNWLINGRNSGTVAGITFLDFNNLTGGTGDDVFTLQTNGALTGVLRGGAGNDIFDLTVLNSDVSVAIDENLDADFNVLDIENIQANTDAGLSNTLIAANANNVWNINGVNSGLLNNTNFSGFENLTGGSLNDSFTLKNSDSITGLINGGGGAGDALNIQNLSRDITVVLAANAGGNSSDTLYVNNIETINASFTQNNTIIGYDIASAWSIDGTNVSSVESLVAPDAETTVKFTGFSVLSGGNNDDTFEIVNATNIAQINGGDGAGNDSIDYSNILADVNINVGGALTPDGVSIDGIEGLIGNNDGTSTFNSTISVADGNNTWNILDFDGAGIADGINDGQFVDTNGNIITFIDFNILQGGDGVDIFNVSAGASITGQIHGGAGADRLNLTIGGRGEMTFIGGAGDDSVWLAGGGNEFSASYSSDVNGNQRLTYTGTNGNSYTVSYNEVERVQDDALATDFTIVGSTATDSIELETGLVTINGATALAYTNKTNLILSGDAGDIFNLVGDLNLGSGSLTVNNSWLTNSTNSTVVANSLLINAASGLGTSNERVNTDVVNLELTNMSGDVYLNEANTIELQNININGLFDLITGGDVTQGVNSVLTGNNLLSINSTGNIDLTNQNQFTGSINLISTGDIALTNAVDTDLSTINAQNLTLNISGNISDSGALTVSGITEITTNNNDIILDNEQNNFNVVNISSANNVSLTDTESLALNSVDITGELQVNADNLTTTDLVVANSIALNASGTARIDSELQSRGGDININANQIEQNANIVSAANIAVTSQQSINMAANASSTTNNGNISYSATGNVNMSLLTVPEGVVSVASSNGQIVDNNGEADNIVADRAELTAANGIGVNDPLETQLNTLFAENTQGNININNRGTITLERLATLGDVKFNNADMDGSDIYFMPGSVDVGYDTGSLFMTTNGGSFLGVGETPEFENADIVARAVTFFDTALIGNFGSLTRPLVLRVRDTAVITVRANLNPQFAPPLPDIDDSGSLLNFSAVDTISIIAGGQVELESLVEVDPAIFTDLRNYNQDETAIRMPRDQRYDDEEEEDNAVGF